MGRPIVKFSEEEVLHYGLCVVNIESEGQIKKRKLKNRCKDFRSMFGSQPCVVCAIVLDLQKETDIEYRVQFSASDPWRSLKEVLLTMHFLKKYPDEVETKAVFGWSDRTSRDIKWKIIRCLQNLQKKKIFLTVTQW